MVLTFKPTFALKPLGVKTLLDVNHYTNNRKCPVYQNKLSLKKERIGIVSSQPMQWHRIYTNIQGLLNDFNQLQMVIEENKPDFIMLFETHLTDEVNKSEIETVQINQYSILSKPGTGSVIIYFKKC